MQIIYRGRVVGKVDQDESGFWWTPLCEGLLRATGLKPTLEEALEEVAFRCELPADQLQVTAAINVVDEAPESHDDAFWDTKQPGRLDTQDTNFPAGEISQDLSGTDPWANRRQRQGKVYHGSFELFSTADPELGALGFHVGTLGQAINRLRDLTVVDRDTGELLENADPPEEAYVYQYDIDPKKLYRMNDLQNWRGDQLIVHFRGLLPPPSAHLRAVLEEAFEEWKEYDEDLQHYQEARDLGFPDDFEFFGPEDHPQKPDDSAVYAWVREGLQALGYDGIVYRNLYEDDFGIPSDRKRDSYILFNHIRPTKAVPLDTGTFDTPEELSRLPRETHDPAIEQPLIEQPEYDWDEDVDERVASRVQGRPASADEHMMSYQGQLHRAGAHPGSHPRFNREGEEQSSGSSSHPHADAAPVWDPNAQVTWKTDETYRDIAQQYGQVTPGEHSNLKFYDYTPHARRIDELAKQQGYDVYLAGGKYEKPDLANRNYNTGHLMVYDPTPGSGGTFDDEQYTKAWRTIHELAHAQVYDQLNEMYGEGRRIGKLGWQRTPREAKRAVHWEWLAAHRQRELAEEHLGYVVPDEVFNQELNTVLHDAVHRAVTGKFTNPDLEGFVPSKEKVPLEVALGMVDEAARKLGLPDDDSLLTPVQKQELRQRKTSASEEEVLARIRQLEEQALAAYERGEFQLAEDLDAEYADLVERLGQADAEDEVAYDIESFHVALWEMAEAYDAFQTGETYNGQLLSKEDLVERLDGIIFELTNKHFPPAQLLDAAQDAAARMSQLRGRRQATPRGFELGDLTEDSELDNHTRQPTPRKLDDAFRWSESYTSENQFEDPNLKLGQHADEDDYSWLEDDDDDPLEPEEEQAAAGLSEPQAGPGTEPRDLLDRVTFVFSGPREWPKKVDPEDPPEVEVRPVVDGYSLGYLSLILLRDAEGRPFARVTGANIAPGLRGYGLGKQMYRTALDWVRDHNAWMESDVAVSEAARRVWRSLMQDALVSKRPRAEERAVMVNEDPETFGDPEDFPWDYEPEWAPELHQQYRSAQLYQVMRPGRQVKRAQTKQMPVACVDLDGTLLEDPDYETTEPSGQPGLGVPKPGAAGALKAFKGLGWQVIIHTARFAKARTPEQAEQMHDEIVDYLQRANIPFDDVATGPKPVADYYIDDKAVLFDGDWWAVVKKITKQAAYPPVDEDRLRNEIRWMSTQLGKSDELAVIQSLEETSYQNLQSLWQTYYAQLDVNEGYPEMARVTVHSPNVVETHTMDAAYCLYGAGSEGIRTPWCSNRSRSLYESYGGGGLRRFLVLPSGPDDHVQVDGQDVPVAHDAYTFAVDSRGFARNVNDYDNRYFGQGMDVEKGVQAAQILDRLMGFSTADFFAGIHQGWEGFENAEDWADNGFTQAEALQWRKVLQTHADWADSSQQPDIAKEFEHLFQDLATAAPWVEASTGDVEAARSAYNDGLTPAQLKAYWRAVGTDYPDTEAFASMARMQVTPAEYRANHYVLSGVDSEIAGECLRFVIDFPDSEVDPEWVAQDYKRRRKWVEKNPEAADEWAEALDDLEEGEAPQAFIQHLARLGVNSPEDYSESPLRLVETVAGLRVLLGLQKQRPELDLEALVELAKDLDLETRQKLVRSAAGTELNLTGDPNDWGDESGAGTRTDLSVDPKGGGEQHLVASMLRPPPRMVEDVLQGLREMDSPGRFVVGFDSEDWPYAAAAQSRFPLQVEVFHPKDFKRGDAAYSPEERLLKLPIDAPYRMVMHEMGHYTQHLLSGRDSDLLHPGTRGYPSPKVQTGNPFYELDDALQAGGEHALSDVEFWPRIIEYVADVRHTVSPRAFLQDVGLRGVARDSFFRTLKERAPAKWRQAVKYAYQNLFAQQELTPSEWVMFGPEPKLPPRQAARMKREANKKLKGLERMLGQPMDDAVTAKLRALDPDTKKGYLSLAVRLARQAAGDPNAPDVAAAQTAYANALELLEQFDTARRFSPVKQMTEVETLEALQALVRDANQSYWAEPRAERVEYELLGDRVIRLDSKDAAALISGGDTSWCFGKWDQDFYNTYDANGQLYIVFPSGPTMTKRVGKDKIPYAEDRYGVHVSSGGRVTEIKDADNDEVDADVADNIVRILSEATGQELEFDEGGWEDYGLGRLEWEEAGFDDPQEAAFWSNHGFDAADAGLWWNSGFGDPEEAQLWANARAEPEIAAKLASSFDPTDLPDFDLTEELAQKLAEEPDQLNFLGKLNEPDKDDLYEAWKEVALNSAWGLLDEPARLLVLLRKVKDLTYSDQELGAIREAWDDSEELDALQVLADLATSGLSVPEIRQWADEGHQVTGFASGNMVFAASGLSLDEWERFIESRAKAERPSAEELREWVVDHTMDVETALRWLDAGASPANAEAWSKRNFTPEEAAKWGAADWAPHEAARQRERGLQLTDPPWWDPAVDTLVSWTQQKYEQVESFAAFLKERGTEAKTGAFFLKLLGEESAKELLSDMDEASASALRRVHTLDPALNLFQVKQDAQRLSEGSGLSMAETLPYARFGHSPTDTLRYLRAVAPFEEAYRGADLSIFEYALRQGNLEEKITRYERAQAFRERGMSMSDWPDTVTLEEALDWRDAFGGAVFGRQIDKIRPTFSPDDVRAIAQQIGRQVTLGELQGAGASAAMRDGGVPEVVRFFGMPRNASNDDSIYAQMLADAGLPPAPGEVTAVRWVARLDDWYVQVRDDGWYWHDSRRASWLSAPQGPSR